MSEPADRLPQGLAEDVLSQPVELLKWVTLVGPRIATMTEDDRAAVLAQMGAIASGTRTAGVTIQLGEKNIAISTETVGEIHQD
ncbi:hypothetical protein [Gordonia sp. N1V]|uniref:hypothetical protein n=1 Tax=Gordonia sp. N1V TaxID=3034163 RepID=UPI0023E2E9FA|nr:hypothetical protein [Gordonia sp. N1V]MDF3280941.1 hypothetical protein [Gordonia sp. N1V]